MVKVVCSSWISKAILLQHPSSLHQLLYTWSLTLMASFAPPTSICLCRHVVNHARLAARRLQSSTNFPLIWWLIKLINCWVRSQFCRIPSFEDLQQLTSYGRCETTRTSPYQRIKFRCTSSRDDTSYVLPVCHKFQLEEDHHSDF